MAFNARGKINIFQMSTVSLEQITTVSLAIIVIVINNLTNAVLPLEVWPDKHVLMVHWILVDHHVFLGFPFFPFPLASDVDADNYDEEQNNTENSSTHS